jgi:hypothetical protein
MTDEKEVKNRVRKKKKDEDWPLPFCTTAPAPELFRAADEDEPCDDSRATEFEEEKDET